MDRYFLATLILTMCAVISPAYSQVQCYTGLQCPAGREVNHTMTGVQGRTESVAECCQVRGGGSLRLLEDPGGPCRECSKDVCTWCNIAPTLTFVRRGSDADLNLRCQGQLPDVPDVVSNGICADVTLKIEEAPNPLPTTAACNATITRTYTAEDACENMVHVVQMITIREMGLPVFTFVPPNITVECGTYIKNPDLTGGWAIARSACGDPVGVNFTDRIISDNLCNESIARTWTAVDDCGNQISVRQIIYLQITIPPTILLPEVEDIFTCDENLGPYLAVDRSATLDRDNSCAFVSYPRLTHSDTLTNGTANGGSRTVTRTWTVTDICGNSASRTQLITVHHKTGLDFGFPVGFPTDLFITLNDTCANDSPAAQHHLN
ncbi:uncharacterized protein LOC106169070 isoform X2 [Lingula anatina]|nr:uncharacterized protein LOC106169070 isoform X2 [Lingula anatina]|eukprot:XP_013403828.1 uncharacterized protein LOC106169070 isoform X2 [Lingula anatina]